MRNKVLILSLLIQACQPSPQGNLTSVVNDTSCVSDLTPVYHSLGYPVGSGLPVAHVCGECSKSNPLAGFEARVDPVEDGRPRLMTYGDSITQGIYRCYENVSHYEWPGLVADALNMQSFNEGVGATLFGDDAEYGKIMKTTYQPTDIVVILSTHNDMPKYPNDPVHLAQLKVQFAAAVTHVVSFGATIYLATPINTPTYNAQTHADYEQMLKDVVNENGSPHAHIVDISSQWVDTAQTIGSDLVHPSAYGDQVLADEMVACIQGGQCQ